MENKKIKILYTIPNFDTAGSGKVVYDLVKYLDTERFEPHICCMHARGDFFKEIEKLKVPIHLFPFTASYRPFLSFPYRLLKIVKFLKKHRFDLIHSWHWSSDFSEPLAVKLAGIPFVYTKKNMGWGNRAWKWRSQLSTKIITLNIAMKERFFENFKSKTIEIPIGTDLSYYTKKVKESLVIALPANAKVILTIANVLPIKGIDILLESVLKLNDADVHVIVLGNQDSEYGEMIKTKYNQKRIHFISKQLDIRPYLQRTQVFVLSSRSLGEGQPMALIEAMGAGIPSIGSNVSGIQDVLKKFKSCLFESENNKELGVVLERVLKLSKDEQSNLGTKMQEHVLQRYDLTKFINSHEQLYTALL